MNTPSNALHETRPVSPQVAFMQAAGPMYWSIRRELWENRSIYLAPLVAAVVFLFGFLIKLINMRRHMGTFVDRQQLETPYDTAALLIMGVAFLVSIFYTLDALYGERRDRSILFWKSLPVSDVMAVLSKLLVAMAILPLLAFVITIATHFAMFALSGVVLIGTGVSAGSLWGQLSFFHFSGMLLYHLMTVHGLWYAPMYGWLLLVSAWAPRAPFLWAFLPPFVIWGVEKLAFNTSYFLSMLQRRLMGPQPSTAPASNSLMDAMAAHSLGEFLSLPGLWIGLAICAAFLVAAVRLRRYRGPI